MRYFKEIRQEYAIAKDQEKIGEPFVYFSAVPDDKCICTVINPNEIEDIDPDERASILEFMSGLVLDDGTAKDDYQDFYDTFWDSECGFDLDYEPEMCDSYVTTATLVSICELTVDRYNEEIHKAIRKLNIKIDTITDQIFEYAIKLEY